MKNIQKTLIAFVASLGLLLGAGAIGGAAQAAPYPDSVKTSAQIVRSGSVTEGKTFAVKVKVRAGNVTINGGSVRVRFASKNYVATVKKGVASFRVKAPKVSRTTTRTLSAKYTRSSTAVFKSSAKVYKSIKVKNKK